MSTDSAFPGKGEKTQTAFYCTTTPPHQHALRQVGRLNVLARYLGPLHLGWTEKVEWRRLRLRVRVLCSWGPASSYWGINVRYWGFIRASQGVTHPRFRIAGVKPQPVSFRTWGCRILTLHLNYVAGEQRNFSKLFVRKIWNMTSVK